MILVRHAEALFWVGRYLERAEGTSRWLDIAGRSAMHLLPADAAIEWAQLVRALGLTEELAASRSRLGRRDVSYFVMAAPDNPGSVRSSVAAVRDNLRVARDRIPVELWEEVSRLHLRLGRYDVAQVLDDEPNEIYAAVREGCQTITGVMAEAMTRDEGYSFIAIGRMLERAILTVGLLGASLSNPRGVFDGERVLRSCSALQAYRRAHGHHADPTNTVLFVLQAANLPRSVFWCLLRAEQRLTDLSTGCAAVRVPVQLVGRLRSSLEYGQIGEGVATDAAGVLRRLDRDLLQLADAVNVHVFRPQSDLMLHSQFVRPGRATPAEHRDGDESEPR